MEVFHGTATFGVSLAIWDHTSDVRIFEIFEYLFNRDQSGDWLAICLYFASHKPLHSLDVEPSAAPRVFLPLPLPWPRTHALPTPVRACVLPAPGLDRGIWLRYNGLRQTQQHGQLSAGLAVSIFMDSALTRRHAALKVCGDTGATNVVLLLWLPHAARCLVSTADVRKTTSVQLQPRIAIDLLTGRPSSATWVVHYTRKMQEIMHKSYFTLLWV